MPSSARHRQPAIPDLAYRGGSRVLAADQPQWLSVIGTLTCRVPYRRLFAAIEGYCGIAEVAPDLPVLRSPLLSVVRGVPRWSCA